MPARTTIAGVNVQSEMADLTAISLADTRSLSGGVLTPIVGRVLAEAKQPIVEAQGGHESTQKRAK